VLRSLAVLPAVVGLASAFLLLFVFGLSMPTVWLALAIAGVGALLNAALYGMPRRARSESATVSLVRDFSIVVDMLRRSHDAAQRRGDGADDATELIKTVAHELDAMLSELQQTMQTKQRLLDSISSLAEVVGGLRSLADCVLALEDSQVPTGSADAGSSLQRAIADAAEAMDAVLGAARQLTQRDRRLVANWGIAIDGIQRRIGDSVHPWADARDAHDDHGAAVLARLNRMLYELRFAARVERILKAFDADILHRLHHAGAPAKVF